MSLMFSSPVVTPALGSFTFSSRPRSNYIVMSAVRSNSASTCPILTKFQKDCDTPTPYLRNVANAIADDMRDGLAVEGGGDLEMILTFVDALPSGNEEGLFYALDLGGTNFRVRSVQLGGKKERVLATESEQISISQKLMIGTSEELFGFIASKLASFVAKEKPGRFLLEEGRKRELGFTFSFPVKQTSIDSGTLSKWTKGFKVSGMEGKNVVACLNEAMEAHGLDMRVSALVNDGVGTLAGARYWDEDVMVGVILGTGTNACYVEQKHAIPKLRSKSSSGTTIINTEWGGFSKILPQTIFDLEMDETSLNPGEHLYEKMISGMYLGEIVRRVLLHMCETSDLFGHFVPAKLSTPLALRTEHLCKMQEDNTDDLRDVGSILYDFLDVEANMNARRRVVEVCDTVVKRGGRLAGAGIVAILEKIEKDTKRMGSGKRTVVAMDGALYEKYPQYRQYMQDALVELLGHKLASHVAIKHTKDVSGLGAALLAATNSIY
ncbi:Hexokinase N-terminal [Arabidopsis thaliana x Arabidopsis arenosa]|uniref:Phosphotransferase n=2 Tax=Arabidopsis TaxID=3701 RepID=A0A178WJK2_ARATH|nr:Hexokinase N-terminal [Arabidopsis thaliana x Arabidopsis arenosa]OAP17715.1 HXK3 [Arabidopsis thaliana]